MKKSKPQKTAANEEVSEEPSKDDFLIVGIGASAGGVQALKTFFENVPTDSGAAYVVILHLSPDHDSQLAAILQTVSKIPVTQVKEKVKVEANHVYVVPPNESLSMADGHIVVSPIHTVEERRAPVDIFFRTLAESHCARAVAVILSGTGANGSMGIKRVKENGGAAFVQNPREAEFSEMPRNSIATDLIDEILNVAEIPQKIVAYGENLGKIVIPIEPENREEEQQSALREIFTQLRVRTGHDFTNYKRPTVLRRIERRINVRNLPDVPAYAAYLKENQDETTALLKDSLISVTNFFRDKEAFDFLEREVVPQMLLDKKAGDEIRVWIAGCATGEEAYSLAMLLAEKLNDSLDAPSIQIFATDIDEAAIAAARNGFYTLNDAADVSPERLRRFFTQEKDGYRVRRELREMILFANHNLLKDPPFSRLDLATCRNLLIYFNHAAQERAMETFHFALRPGGYLFLGSSESVDGASDLYAPVNREQRIFQSRSTAPRFSHPVPDLSPSFRFDIAPKPAGIVEKETRPAERISYGDLHGEILEQFAPPSIVINENFDIVHVSANAGRYLRISGEVSKNLFELVRPELRLELSTAVYQAVERRKNVVAENLRLNIDDRRESVSVQVRPVLRFETDAARGFIVILFQKTGDAPGNDNNDNAEAVYSSPEPAMRQLEEALLSSRSEHRHAIEHSEIQAEELKASNEELQAINEELRSATEELETGKEELQSVNEELVTVNQELKIKIEELSNSNNDLQNLMNSTNIGTIFLDRALRVKMFTPAALEIFNLIPADIGRGLSDITHRLEGENLIRDVETVLSKLQSVEREVRTADGNVYLMQIAPYRTAEDRIGGTIVTFVNITTRKEQEDELRSLTERLARQARVFDTTLSNITDFTYIFDREGRFVYSNRPLLDLLGITLEEITGKNFSDLHYPEDLAERLQRQIRHVFETGETVKDETPFTSEKTGVGGFYEYIFSPIKAEGGAVEAVAGSTRGITARKRHEAELEFFADFSQSLISLSDESKIIEVFGERISRLTNASVCALFEINDAKNTAEIVAEWHQAESRGLNGLFNIPELVSAEFERRMAAGETVVVRDIRTDSHAKGKAQLARFGIGSFVNVPLVRNDEWTLVLGVYHEQPYDWRDDEIALLGEAANRAWAKITTLRADEELRESETRTRIAVEAAGMGTWDWNVANDEVRWNERHFTLFGMEPQPNPISPAAFFDRIHEDDREWVTARLKEAVENQTIFAAEFRARLENTGEVRWMEGYGQAVEVADGKTVRMSGVMSDINERKNSRERLLKSEERLQMVLKNLPGGAAFIVDREYRYLLAEGESLHAAGFASADFVGKTLSEALSPALAAEYEPFYEKALAGEPFTHEHESHDRTHITRGMPLRSPDGEIYAVLAVSFDLTDRKQAEEDLRESEERLSLIINSIEDYAIITTDPDGIINGWNPGAEKIFGYAESEILGKNSEILFTPEDREKGVPTKERRTAAAQGKSEDERFHLRKDGSRFYASGLMQPLKDGEIEGFVKIARDMTDKIAVEAIKRDKLMLQKLVGAQEDERKRIARDLHDELGQLLTALRLKLEAVRKICGDDAELCGKVDESQLLAKRVDDGVDFLAWELRPAALDDLGLHAALAKYVKEWSHYSGVTAELLGSATKKLRLAPEVETNLYRIAQEALNNIHKYAKAKAVEISLNRREENFIVLIIADDGKGFHPKTKFNRSKGIGLIGMKERAALIGGTFEIESAPKKGTTIYVRVPAAPENKEAEDDE